MDDTSRSTNLYILRFIAAIGVILIHLTGTGFAIEVTIDSFARFSVPVFVLISGYCVLPKADSFAYVIKKSCRLFLIMLFWSFIYYLYYWAEGELAFNGVKALFKYLLTEPIYFWYFYMTICLYLISPALKLFMDNADKKLFLYVLGFCFLFGSLVTMTVRSEISPTFNAIVEKSKAAYNVGFPCLFLTGGYIYKFGIERRHRYIIYLFGILTELLAVIYGIYTLRANAYSDLLSSFYAPNAILMGIAVFVAVMYFPDNPFLENPQVQKTVKYLSSLTLGIYVIHPIVTNFLGSVEFASDSLCLKFLTVSSVSLLIAMCIKRLPWLRKSI